MSQYKFSSSYPPTTQLQQYIDIVIVLEEAVESDYVFVTNTTMDVYLLRHLHSPTQQRSVRRKNVTANIPQ